MSFSDDRPLTVAEKREFALAYIDDAASRATEAEAKFLAAPRGSEQAAETWKERNAALSRVNELREMIAGPPPLSPHAPRQFRDDLHEAWAAAPLSPFARLGQELQQMSVPHYPREGAPFLDALTPEQQDELAFVVPILGAHTAAELELGTGMHASQLLEVAGTGPRVPDGTPGHVRIDGCLLAKIARGLPRALRMAEAKARRPFDPGAAAAKRRGWSPGGTR